jgi:hypothetical protein
VFVITDASVEVPVEVLEAGPRWTFSGLAANFARVELLIGWYGGDPDRYLDAVARGAEDESDVPFLVVIKQRLSEDPGLLDDMRRIVDEFASRFST